jgi:hypothetical protein
MGACNHFYAQQHELFKIFPAILKTRFQRKGRAVQQELLWCSAQPLPLNALFFSRIIVRVGMMGRRQRGG